MNRATTNRSKRKLEPLQVNEQESLISASRADLKGALERSHSTLQKPKPLVWEESMAFKPTANPFPEVLARVRPFLNGKSRHAMFEGASGRSGKTNSTFALIIFLEAHQSRLQHLCKELDAEVNRLRASIRMLPRQPYPER